MLDENAILHCVQSGQLSRVVSVGNCLRECLMKTQCHIMGSLGNFTEKEFKKNLFHMMGYMGHHSVQYYTFCGQCGQLFTRVFDENMIFHCRQPGQLQRNGIQENILSYGGQFGQLFRGLYQHYKICGQLEQLFTWVLDENKIAHCASCNGSCGI